LDGCPPRVVRALEEASEEWLVMSGCGVWCVMRKKKKKKKSRQNSRFYIAPLLAETSVVGAGTGHHDGLRAGQT
jgi:hypothetical protein